jgi:hypothetical protein
MPSSFVEDEVKARKEAAEAAAGPKNSHQETLKQILANEKQSALFVEYLNAEYRGDLAEIVASGKFDAAGDNENDLTKMRHGFLEVIERSDKTIESLDDQSLKELIASSDELTKIAERNGPEGIRNVIKLHLPKIAIADRDRFEIISIHATNIAEQRKKGGEIDEEIKESFKEYGISDAEIKVLIKGGDAREIAEAIREKMGGWAGRKKKEMQIRQIQRTLENLASMSAQDIKNYIDGLEAERKILGDRLALALVENPILHEAILTDLRSEAVKGPGQEASFKDGKNILNFDQKAAVALWERKRDAYRNRNEQAIFDFHRDEWLGSQLNKAFDAHYAQLLDGEFRIKLDAEINERQRVFRENHLQPYMDATGTDEAHIPGSDMDWLKSEFATVTGKSLEIDDAEKQRMFYDLKAAYDNDDAKQKEIMDNFAPGYHEPVPDAALEQKWRDMAREASKPDAAEPQWEAMQDDFVRDYTETHMKGKKGGTWTNIFKELFTKGLFDLLS